MNRHLPLSFTFCVYCLDLNAALSAFFTSFYACRNSAGLPFCRALPKDAKVFSTSITKNDRVQKEDKTIKIEQQMNFSLGLLLFGKKELKSITTNELVSAERLFEWHSLNMWEKVCWNWTHHVYFEIDDRIDERRN